MNFLLLVLLLVQPWLATCKRIAVIGGGISGAFASKYLAEYDKGCALQQITIFDPLTLGEQTTIISSAEWQGSRVSSVRLRDNSVVEIGASVFYSGFHLIMEMIEGDDSLEVGIAFNTGSTKTLHKDLRRGMGIYNGYGDWPFLTSNFSKWYSLMLMAWRYNIDLYRVFSATDKVEYAFKIIHNLLLSEHETTFFENAAEMWDAVGLLKPAHGSFDDFLDAIAVCGSKNRLPWWRQMLPYQGCIREELLAAVTLCNYNQAPSSVNGLVGLGSFVAAKVQLLSVMGGNHKLMASAYRQAKAIKRELCGNADSIRHVKQRVTTLVSSNKSVELFSRDVSLGKFDVVILAAPYHMAQLQFFVQSDKDAAVLQPMPFSRFDAANHNPHRDGDAPVMSALLPDYATRPFTQVVTTLISGAVLNATYFKLETSNLPRSIYMTEHAKGIEHNITAISQITPTGSYKVFSNNELNKLVLKTFFGEKHTVEVVKIWGGPHGGATADYQGAGKTVNYQLFGDQLYYPNSIETSMSCMELSAIGAKSVAKLIAKNLGLLIPHNGTQDKHDEL
mmetsp:Transcript_26408/g.40028  ORF Transcript_26408/g.40028 Transcript_26408/m.40028 type:complete len:561 (-) Transcript_26408:426-2108(-)